MTDGQQHILGSGNGMVDNLIGGSQYVSNGGRGTAGIVNNYGNQVILDGGMGIANTMSGGYQQISSGGSGLVSSMTGSGFQAIGTSGHGTVIRMNSGQQQISSTGVGTVTTMSGGSQVISSGGTGTVNTMNNGQQQISSTGVGSVDTMHSGKQAIGTGGSGIISNMSGGSQAVSSGGKGTVISMNSGGTQTVSSGGTGTVNTMNSGSQVISSTGHGTANTMNGGSQVISNGGVGTVSDMSGGTQAVSSGGTAAGTLINGGTQIVSNGGIVSSAVLSAGQQQVYDGSSLHDITFAGGTQMIMNNAAVSGMQVTAGMQLVASGGSALATLLNDSGVMQLASGGTVSGLTMSGGSLELETVSGGSFTIGGTMTVGGGSVNMTDSGVTRAGSPFYETLTIDNLSGGGATFIMDTDLGSDNDSNSDKITISSAGAGGTCYVQVKDLSGLNGSEVTGAHHQKLITDTDGNLTFVGQNLNTGGLWDIDPTLARGDTLNLSANDWYLVKIAKTANNDTRVLLDAADNSYALWRNTNDSLRSRLGALGNGSEHADGIWARTQAGRFSGAGYEGRYNMYQLGFDQSVNDQSIYGAAADYGDGTGSYEPGSGKDKLKTFSLYGVWRGDNGAYTNVTARYGIVDTELESYGDFPDKAEYKQHAYSVSVEYGKRFDMESGLFIEPNVQFTLGRLGSIDYTTNRGANGYIEGMNSAIGRIGFVMGQKIENGSDIYLKADLLHEFAGERDLQLTSDAGGTNDILTKHNDYGDTWFELGLGGNVRISKTGNFYGEVTRGFGGDINKKWSVNAGLRFTF